MSSSGGNVAQTKVCRTAREVEVVRVKVTCTQYQYVGTKVGTGADARAGTDARTWSGAGGRGAESLRLYGAAGGAGSSPGAVVSGDKAGRFLGAVGSCAHRAPRAPHGDTQNCKEG